MCAVFCGAEPPWWASVLGALAARVPASGWRRQQLQGGGRARWLSWGSSGCANLYQTRLSSSACLRARTCWRAPFPAAWRPLPLMEALAELPVLGLLARQHMAWAGHAAHGCLVLTHSTVWEPEGIPFHLHTVQAIKGAAAPPSLSRTLQLGCLKGSYSLSGRCFR